MCVIYFGVSHAAFPEVERATSPAPSWAGGADGAWHAEPLFEAGAWGQQAAWAAPGPAAGGPGWAMPGIVDEEALIAVELCFVKGDGDSEDLHIANILFNNLDIIGEFQVPRHLEK